MDILLIFFVVVIFSAAYVVLGPLFGFSDNSCEVRYEYEREIRYEEPPF